MEREKRSVMLSIAVTPRDVEAMRRGAEQDQGSLSSYVRHAVIMGMRFNSDPAVKRYAAQELYRSVGSSFRGVLRNAWKEVRAELRPSRATSLIRSPERQKRSVILSLVVTPSDAQAMRAGAAYERKTLSDFLRTSALIGMTFSSDRRVSRHANLEMYRSMPSLVATIVREEWNRAKAERDAGRAAESPGGENEVGDVVMGST